MRQAIEQQSLARLRQHVRAVIGGAAIYTQANRRPSALQRQSGGDTGTESHIGTGAMRNPYMSATQALDLARIEMNPMCYPGRITHPAHVRHKIQGALAEMLQAIILFIAGLSKMGVHPHLMAVGHCGGLAHQLF